MRGGRRTCRAVVLLAVLAAWVAPAAGEVGERPLGALGAPKESSESKEDEAALADQLVALGVDRGELAELIRGSRAAGFTEGELRRVLRLVVRARLAGLPHVALLDKLREGLAKGAGPEAIERALERRAQLLRQAKSLTDTLVVEGWVCPRYSLSVLIVGDALEAGFGAAELLRAVRDGLPPPEGTPDVRNAFRRADGRR